MDIQDWFLFALAFGVPIGATAIGLSLLFRAGTEKHASLIQFKVGENELIASKRLLQGAGILALALWWLEWILPLPLLPILLVTFLILFQRQVAQDGLSASSGELLTEISSMAKQLETTHRRVQSLANQVKLAENEIQRKAQYQKTLDGEIEDRLKQVAEWKSLSDDQKRLFLDTVGEAVSRRSTYRIFLAIVSSIALNIVATLIWTLLGSPGKEDILNLF
ncbi:hypothetical protein LCM28_13360 [Salipiger pacificus]|nr:hypothetical protein [Alloyangia pacifica]